MTFYSTYDEIPFDRINIGVKEREYLRWKASHVASGMCMPV